MRLAGILLLFAGAALAQVPVSDPVFGPAPGVQDRPVVASDGTDFFAAWSDSREGTGATYGARVSADGTVLDPLGIRLSGDGPRDIAFGDGRYLLLLSLELLSLTPDGTVVTRRPASASRVVFTGKEFVLFEQNGRLTFLDRDGVPRGGGPFFPYPSAVAFNGSVLAVVHRDDRRVFATLLGATGRTIASHIDLGPYESTGRFEPSAVWNGREFVIAYGRPSSIDVVRLTEDGVVVSAGAIAAPKDASRVAMARHGGMITMLTYGASTRAIRLDGPPQDQALFGDAESAAIVSNGSRALALAATSADGNLYGVLFAAGGGAERKFVVARAAASQFLPVIARSRVGTLVAWNEDRGEGDTRLMAALIDPAGGRASFELGPTNWQMQPAVAAADDAFLIMGHRFGRILRNGALEATVRLETLAAPTASQEGGDFITTASDLNRHLLLRIGLRGETLTRTSVPLHASFSVEPPALICGVNACNLFWLDVVPVDCPPFQCEGYKYVPALATVWRDGSMYKRAGYGYTVYFNDRRKATFEGTTLRVYERTTPGEYTGGSRRVFLEPVR